MKRQTHLKMEEKTYQDITAKAFHWFCNYDQLPFAIHNLDFTDMVHQSQIRNAFIIYQAEVYNTESIENKLREKIKGFQKQDSIRCEVLNQKSDILMELEGKNCQLEGERFRLQQTNSRLENEIGNYEILLRTAFNIFDLIPQWIQLIGGFKDHVSGFNEMFNNRGKLKDSNEKENGNSE